MPNGKATFNLDIKTSADLQGLNKLKQELNELRKIGLEDFSVLKGFGNDLSKMTELNKKFLEIKSTIAQVDVAFDKAFDTSIGRLNLQTLNKELNNIGIGNIVKSFSQLGTAGNKALLQLTNSATSMTLKLKESSTLLDKMGTTLANTIRWQISSAVLNKFVGSFQEAWGYAKNLDTSLNDIRIVTGKSADEMERFSEVANKTAKTLGAATTDYTKASLIYYQQGLDDLEAQARAEVTIKAANVTGQSADEVSEQLTAVWNGYKVSAEETETYIDKLAAVAASTAADLEELSTGMSKVAAAANAMGVDIDQLNAQLATIVSVTRQAPESVGTALKTVYARMSTISAGGIDDEDGTSLTSYTEKMNKFGINVLDVNGHLRDMGDVIEEIGNKWNTFNREQQVSLAQAMAGTRQYNNLLALFENFDKYQEALIVSQNSLGTLQKQQDIYMESTEAHLQQLSTAAEGVFDSLVDNKSINKLIDGFTKIIELVEKFVDSIGGGGAIFAGLTSLLTTLFSKNIAQTISPIVQNFRDMGESELIKQEQINSINTMIDALNKEKDVSEDAKVKIQELLDQKKQLTEYYPLMTNEEINSKNAIIDEVVEILKEKDALEQLNNEVVAFVQSQQEMRGINTEGLNFTKGGFGLNLNGNELDNFNKALSSIQTNLKLTTSEVDRLIKEINTSDNTGGSDQVTYKLEKELEKLSKQGFPNATIALENFQRVWKEYRKDKNGTDLEQRQRYLENVSNALRDMGDAEAVTEGALEKLNKVVADGATEWAKASNKQSEYNRQLSTSELVARQVAQAYSQLVGSITGVIFGINSLSSAIGSLQENGFSGQVLTGLIFGFSSLVRGINQAADAIKVLNAKMILKNELDKGNVGIATQEIGLRAARILGLKVENNVIEEENAKLVVNNSLKAASNVIALASVAILASLIFAYKSYTKRLEENAKKAKEAADKAKEHREELEEEANLMNDLVTSYQALANQYDKHEISLEDLREKTYELCLSYGETDLALKALIADYDELNKLTTEAAQQANEKIINASIEEQYLAGKSIEKKYDSATKRSSNGTVTALDYGFHRERQENEFAENLRNLGLSSFRYDFLNGQDRFIYDNEEFFDVLKNNRKEVEKLLLEADSSNELAKNFKKYVDAISEELDAYEEATEKYKEYNKKNILLTNQENINSIEEFNNSIEEMSKKAIKEGVFEDTEVGREEAYQWAISSLAGVKDAYNDFSKDSVLAFDFITSHGLDLEKDFNKITKEINGLSASEKLALNYLKDYIEEIDQIKDFKNLGLFLEDQAYNTNIKVAIQDALDGQPLTKEKIQELFKGLDEKYVVEIETKLENKSASNQAYDLIVEGIANQEAQKDDLYAQREQARQETQSARRNYINLNKSAETDWLGGGFDTNGHEIGGYKNLLDHIQESAKDNDIFNSDRILELAEALSDVDGESNKLDSDLQTLLKTLEEKGIVDKNQLKIIGDSSKSYKNYQKVISGFDDTLKALEKGVIDYAQAAEQMTTLHENANKEIDNLQKAYKTYKDTIKEYNKNQALSIDSLQSLVELGPEYLQYLFNENGELQLNEEAMKNATVAQLEQAKASYIQAQAYQVKEIWEKASSLADVQAFIDTYSLAQADYDAADAAIELAVQTMKLKLTMDGFTDSTGRAETAIENWAKAMKGISAQYDKTISYTKNNFGKAMDSSLAKRNKKNLEDEFDRYWDIKNAIEACTDALEELNDLQSHLHGKELIQSLKNENELLAQQAGYYEQLAAAQREEAGELQGKLGKYGAVFDEAGQLLNYAALTKSAIAAYNAGGDEEAYNEFKKLLDRYDKLYYDEMKDTQENIRKLRDEMVENNLKAWETEITIKLDLKEAEREWNDFLKEINEDFTLTYKDLGSEFATIMKDLNTYMTGEGSLATSINALREIEDEIDKMMAGGTSDKFFSVSDAQEKLKEYMKTLEDDTKAMRQLYEDAWDALLDGIDQAADKFDDIMERFDLINDELEYQGQLISLLYGEEAYELMNHLFKAQEFNSLTQIKSLQQQKDMWAQMMSEVEEGTEEWQKYYDNLNDAQKSLNSLVTDYIKLLQDDYLNAVDDILSKLETAIASASLDDVELNWERIADNSAKYFDAIQGGFKIQELANKIKDSINDTDDVAAQQKLQNLYDEEISYLREKENLTQHDIDYAEAKYQITLKQIALEEAQANKTSMKMTRNAQGNWTYQYVANDEDVLNKQQDLSNAYAKLYEIAKKGYQENLQSLQSLNKTYLQKSKEYAKLALTDKDRATKLQAELDEWYFDQYQKLAEENERSMEELHEAQGLSFKNLTEQDMANADIENRYVLAEYTATAQKIADAWNADDGASVKSQILNAHEEITEATDEYQQKVDELANVVGEDFNNIKGAIDEATDSTRALEDATSDLVNEVVPQLAQYRDYVNQCADAWEKAKTAAINSLQVAQEYLRKTGEIARQTASAIAAVGGSYTGPSGGSGSGGGNPSTPETPTPKGSIQVYSSPHSGNAALQTKEYYGTLSYDPKADNGMYRLLDDGKFIGYVTLSLLKQLGLIHGSSSASTRPGTVATMLPFDTGGYTGSWGPDGRIAMLHEKELVLNKDDTKNILSAVDMIRAISGLGTSIERGVANNIGALVAGIQSPGLSAGMVGDTISSADNIVYNIQAEFPNANDVNEIREAILSLPSLASQYANR